MKIMQKKVEPEILSRVVFIMLGCMFMFSGIGKIIIPPPLENLIYAEVIQENILSVLIMLLPFGEIALGILLITKVKIKLVSWVTLVFVMAFIVNNGWLISIDKGFESCGQCLGWGIDIWPVGSLYVDLIMFGMILLGSFNYQKKEVLDVAV